MFLAVLMQNSDFKHRGNGEACRGSPLLPRRVGGEVETGVEEVVVDDW
jgi:hypothetical protein